MRDTVYSLIKEQRFCVLATLSGDAPHCSLMSYGTNTDCSEIYLATIKASQKFRNIMLNPLVSLLIDTRWNPTNEAASSLKSLTIMGKYRMIDSPAEEAEIRSILMGRHPDLGIILDDPDSAVLPIRIKSFLLLDGLDKAYFFEAEDMGTPGSKMS